MNSALRVLTRLLSFYLSYLFVWTVVVMLGIYPSPTLGGEAVVSFYFLMAITLPDALVIISLRRVIAPLVCCILGVITFITVIPKLAFVKYLMSIFGWKSYSAFFAVFCATEFALAYVVLRTVGSREFGRFCNRTRDPNA